MAEKIYTLYKGNQILAEGTIKEIAQRTGVSVNTLRQYAAPSYKKRINGKNHKELVPLDTYSFLGKGDR